MSKERAKKYNDGDRIGPNKILLVKRTKRVKSTYYGVFECPYCKKHFECGIQNIAKGTTKSCGCHRYKDRIGQGRKYYAGDIIGPNNMEILERIDRKKAKFQCKYCGTIFISNIQSVIHGECTSCGCIQKIAASKNGRLRMKDLTGKHFGKLTVIEDSTYRNGGKHVLWKCQCDCGNITYVRTSDLIQNRIISCGCVKQSTGEFLIQKFLDSHGISYEKEKIFDDCINPKTNYKLRFDFYLPDYNYCIEFDGQQHFEESSMCSDTLEDRQYRDNIKNEYCIAHNLQLLRISYLEKDNIDCKLEEIFS